MAYNEFIRQLNEQEWFSRFVKEVLIPNAPSIPSYNPQTDNTERWKYDSAMLEGYLSCMKKFVHKDYIKQLGVKDD